MTNSNPYDKSHELARAIRESEIYQRYVAAQRKLDQNLEAKEKIRNFRTLQMEVNQAHIMGQAVADDKVAQVTLEYAKINQEELIAEFFNAEGLFIQMFTDIQQIIQKSIESDFSE